MLVITGDQVMNIINKAESKIIKDMESGNYSKEAIQYAYMAVHELSSELTKAAKEI